MSEEAEQNHRECMKEYRKNWSNNVLKKLKQKSWTEKNVLISLIKDEVENFSGIKFYADDDSEEGRQV